MSPDSQGSQDSQEAVVVDLVGGEEPVVGAEVEVETTAPTTGAEAEEKKNEGEAILTASNSATTVETQDSGIVVKDLTDGRKAAALERRVAAEKSLKG
jgi:FKBP-type peptidyl-prolyl cis-trans isomerase